MDTWTQAGITVLGAVTAVSATEWCVRARERRRCVEQATLELALLIPYVTVAISDVWQGLRPETGVGSEWAKQRDRVSGLLTQVRVNARWPLRRSRLIRAEVDDLAARIAAADIAWNAERRLIPGNELYELVPDLVSARVFPGTRPLDEAFKWYREHGFGSGRPPDPQHKVSGWRQRLGRLRGRTKQ